MQLLASALAATALLLVACDDNNDINNLDDGADTCYGGYGVVVKVAHGACAAAGVDATFDKTQITFTSDGAQQFYDLAWDADIVSEVWPAGFQRFASVQIDVLLYSEAGPCRLSGTASAVVDPEVCATVDVAANTCDCSAP